MSQKSRSSRRSAHTSSTKTSGMPSTRYAASTTGLPSVDASRGRPLSVSAPAAAAACASSTSCEDADHRHRDRRQRDDARRAAREARRHVAADHQEEEQEARGREVRDVAQARDQVAGHEAGQHGEHDEAEHRAVGGRAIEIEPVGGDLADAARPPRAAGRAPRTARGGSRRARARTASGTPPARTTRTGRSSASSRPSVSQRLSSLTNVATHQLQVEPEAAVADVEDVVAQLVARVREVAAAELRQPGHARAGRRSAPRSCGSRASRWRGTPDGSAAGRPCSCRRGRRSSSCGISSSFVRFRKRPTGV